jgi:hypothetical protein
MKAQPTLEAATKAPWRTGEAYFTPSESLWTCAVYDEAHGFSVAVCKATTREAAEANAKLIVRAINSHAALVAALEQCLILIEKPTLWEVSGRAWHPDEVKREAKAALALARGNQSNP